MLSLNKLFRNSNMNITKRSLINSGSTNLCNKPQSPFCESPKIETLSFKSNSINNHSKLSYTPIKPLTFKNNKCLLYKYTPSLLQSLKSNLPYTSTLTLTSTLLYTNPFMDTFPAAVPILWILTLVGVKMWGNYLKKRGSVVSEIYLIQGGEATEVWFANQAKRRLFGEEWKKIYYNSVFVEPDYQREEVVLMNKDKRLFPTDVVEMEKQLKEQKYGDWHKFFSNGENFIILPKNAQTIESDVLVEIFKGKVIQNKMQ